MLKSLKLTNVGPAPELQLQFADRMNLITGDNGLGKTFLLDVAWWALTRRWPRQQNVKLTSGFPARPTNSRKPATISFELTAKVNKSINYVSTYSASDQAWIGKAGRPWNPGLVIYAHADGGFSVWDPARNYWKKRGGVDIQERLPCFVFSPLEVWEGLAATSDGKAIQACNGLLADWASWIREDGDNAQNLRRVIGSLTPEGEPYDLGPLTRMSIDDARDIPSIKMPYGQNVPVLHASSGIRRIMALSYMLLWCWNEHHIASDQLGESPTNQVVLLFDELEGHLHPRWQRTILQSLLKLSEEMHTKARIQLIAATHSPLILASAEPFFDAKTDAWFDLDLEKERVELHRRPFISRGDVSNWLTSEAFDLATPLSREAETALQKALAVLRASKPKLDDIEEASHALEEARLPDTDPFWSRWRRFAEEHTASVSAKARGRK